MWNCVSLRNEELEAIAKDKINEIEIRHIESRSEEAIAKVGMFSLFTEDAQQNLRGLREGDFFFESVYVWVKQSVF